ncbi:glycoside hydrolase family 9 protein [Cellvibrio sp. pealriver]|uniref:glycoside hydrolase family 9 protein n=1 Tax=Cellvibrio sp. pealriver TaxID=1622269 RepID=UPI0009E3EC9C|nr:glycoside hydrolase family 9 protein [Cellvibrio sp. pealriver]
MKISTQKPIATTVFALSVLATAIAFPLHSAANGLALNDKDYFEMQGLNVTVFSDIYPDGHQTGVTVIQHGSRVAANGDLRLEISPGQWSPVPVGGKQTVDKKTQTITQSLSYPDPSKDRKGFNPIIYPDLKFTYDVKVTALDDNQFKITVDLEKPLPQEWVGKIGFNFEIFPGEFFGKSWLMDTQAGIFPQQPNGPLVKPHGEYLTAPLASGKKLVIAPDSDKQRMVIDSKTGVLELWDGRANHNNGWYIVRGVIPADKTTAALEWIVTPHVIKNWVYEPVIQVSQLGYGTVQPKKVVIEQDKRDTKASAIEIYKLSESGKTLVKKAKVKPWGNFLRYQYMTYDFSDITEPGMYQIRYRDKISHAFKIGDDVLSRHAWQPTLEYFLPVQMCHMRVNEKYRVWHGLDHQDDALMMPLNFNHIDGYISDGSTRTKYKPGERVPGLDVGGWHDAGDYDLRVESQMGTVWLLATMVEEFGLDHDATLIDQEKKLVEIHVADGKNDALQQIEHGLLSVLGGYKSMGRLYRGIIEPTIRQYVLLGDAMVQTDNLPYDPSLKEGEIKNGKSGTPDDRWVFTEDNPERELDAAAGLAAAARVLKTFNPDMAKDALDAAQNLYRIAAPKTKRQDVRVFALAELILATGNEQYRNELISLQNEIVKDIEKTGWAIGRVMPSIRDEKFVAAVNNAVDIYQQQVRERAKTESPYGVPYKPNIWGAGWNIQEFGVKQYFFHKSWPQLTGTDSYVNALNFILGVHPGENTQSFASGVGANSATVAYGVNRADWSYIPGGVISGTALIRPDLPELKIWPFFWQQTEYVMGGGEANYMFLALAVDQLNTKAK